MLQSLRFGVKPETIAVAPMPTIAPRSTRRAHGMDLNYKEVQNALVITELDSYGHEMPIALAFVTQKGQVVIGYLAELAEL